MDTNIRKEERKRKELKEIVFWGEKKYENFREKMEELRGVKIYKEIKEKIQQAMCKSIMQK